MEEFFIFCDIDFWLFCVKIILFPGGGSMIFHNSMQLKAYLKRQQEKLHTSISGIYTTFFAKILLERICRLNREDIVVKGSLAEFIHLKKMVRSVTDVDLASKGNHHLPLLVINNAMCLEEDTNFVYDYRTSPYKTKTGICKIPLICGFDGIKQPLDIDFRENHPCIFEKQLKEVPAVFEKDHVFYAQVTSLEEHLAEKLCIILENQKQEVLNTRVKDFYDIYELHGGNYDLDKFSYYFEVMLQKRGKMGNNALTTDYLDQTLVRKLEPLWERSKRHYDFLDDEIDLEGSVYYTRGVLREQIQRIEQGKNRVYTLK